ncbi:histidine kinase [Enterococcus sp. JM4C]|uniref:Spo0B domain-containing protein n=1 Tax=Candidatus Enterococcus huntleyi TaxID=1857217 RepID=UPI00137B117C|nr:sensor histidine kinase [Enterococcus sp. JM4C]KAF1296406.1 histidine kinase [Enterococcus sp. JM4C]
MKKGAKLWRLLSVIFITTLIIMITFLYGVMTKQTIKEVRTNQENSLLALGRQLSIEDQVIAALKNNQSTAALEEYTMKVSEIHGLDFVVIMDMSGIRLTHPDLGKIGKHFEGGDELPALKGAEHLSVSEGSLGESLRGFVPVFDGNRQIGVVSMGIKLTSLSNLIDRTKKDYTMSLVVSVGFGLCLAIAVSYYLKKQLHDLEPQEIARLLEERNAMLEETKDAIVVIDPEDKILLANIEATSMFQRMTNQEEELVGRPLSDLILHMEKLTVESKTEQFYQQNGQDYFVSIAPIKVQKKDIGHVVFLKNATETFIIAEQLVSTTTYASALQSQSHEFMNKMHVIYGLVDLEDYTALKRYLADILKPEKEFAQRLAILVRNPVLAGFLSGERMKFSELKTQLVVEIYPEIPPNVHDSDTQNLLALYRYINRFFMEQTLPEEIVQKIEYEGETLTTTFTLAYSKEQLERFELEFQTSYLTTLLSKAKAEIHWENQQDNWLLMVMTVHYEGVRDDKRINY